MIIVITGPTGVGKTKLSIMLAKKYNAEIINGDSVQIYKGLDIGSSKIKEDEKEGIVHHLLDYKEVSEDYSLYEYQKDARKLIEDITKRGKNVIIVGGTGLYIKSVLYDYQLESENNFNNDNYEGVSTEALYQELIKLDKDIIIDKYNRRRVIRALDYYKNNHKSINLNNNGNKLIYDNVVFIGLTIDRDILYKMIDDRVDKMLADGLINEVKGFYDKNIRSRVLLGAIGYKELYQYFDGVITCDKAIELIKRNSRRYAKRQYTFMRNQFDIKWFNVNIDDFSKTVSDVCEYIDNEMQIIK